MTRTMMHETVISCVSRLLHSLLSSKGANQLFLLNSSAVLCGAEMYCGSSDLVCVVEIMN